MILTAVVLPIDEAGRRVLLGQKRRGFGQGKLVGIGGKVEPGEDLAAAAARELCEEVGLLADASQMQPAARLLFRFPASPHWDFQMVVFVVWAWQGEPMLSDEIEPQWHGLDALPLERMWDDARLWLPPVLAGQWVTATFFYDADRKTVVQAVFGGRL
ncbi:MAG: NUDIX domain-containing protein [Anaerolineae bacterium]